MRKDCFTKKKVMKKPKSLVELMNDAVFETHLNWIRIMVEIEKARKKDEDNLEIQSGKGD